jgi:hypothetical protein
VSNFTIPNVEYKFLQANGRSPYQAFQWSLPVYEDGKWTAAGEYMTTPGPLEECVRGFHYPKRDQLLEWCSDHLYAFEPGGEIEHYDTKSACTGPARLLYRIEAWNKQTQRLLAAEYAERVLEVFESAQPNDARPREAIKVARKVAFGLLGDVARAAAEAAAWDAWDAARAAGAAAGAAEAAAEAAEAAAEAAAWDAAWAAARAAWAAARAAEAAARAAERESQHTILVRALWDNERWIAEQRAKVEGS